MRPVLLRVAVYVYVASGLIGLMVGLILAPFVLVVALALLGANWTNAARPLSARRWIPLLGLATLGIARVIFVGPVGGAGGVLS